MPTILVLRGYNPFGKHQEVQPLAGPDFFELAQSTHFLVSLFYQPIRGWLEVEILQVLTKRIGGSRDKSSVFQIREGS